MEAYPDAKVLLTVRDSGERWAESFQKTIGQTEFGPLPLYARIYRLLVPSIAAYFSLHEVMWDEVIYSKDPTLVPSNLKEEDLPKIARIYDEWIEKVKRQVPKERLLVFNAKEGWEPLCKFLEKEIPDEPFPNVNESKEFNNMVRSMAHRSFVEFVLPLILVVSVPLVAMVISFQLW